MTDAITTWAGEYVDFYFTDEELIIIEMGSRWFLWVGIFSVPLTAFALRVFSNDPILVPAFAFLVGLNLYLLCYRLARNTREYLRANLDKLAQLSAKTSHLGYKQVLGATLSKRSLNSLLTLTLGREGGTATQRAFAIRKNQTQAAIDVFEKAMPGKLKIL